MGERIGPNNRLVGLDDHSSAAAHNFACSDDLRRINSSLKPVVRPTGRERHHDLLERSIARPLTNPVDSNFDLARTGLNTRKTICRRKP